MPTRHQLENQNWTPFPNIPPTPYQLTTQTILDPVWPDEKNNPNILILTPTQIKINHIKITQILGILNNELVEIETPDSEPYYHTHISIERAQDIHLITNHEQYWEVIQHSNPTEHEFLTRPPIYALGPEIQAQIITTINIYNAHNL